MVTRIGSMVYDGSVATQLDKDPGDDSRTDAERTRTMDIRAEEISKIIRDQIGSYAVEVDVAEVGTVISIGDGIARVHGLERAMAGEMLEFPHGVFGIALNLEEDSVGAVLLGDFKAIKEGDIVKRTGRIISVPVGDAMLGRVVNALGQPIDGKGPIQTKQFLPIERLAPGVVDRQPVKEPLQTGLKAIDGMVPIGRGQRELIIGDRQTGKTAVAVDTIINQRGKDVICIYNAIGQKQSTVAQVVRTLEEYDAMSYTIVVAAAASDPAPMLYISSVFGLRHRRVLPRQRRHALVVYDDLIEARAGVSRDLAAAAPSAGPRSVSRRRLLSALAPARARREAERAEGGGSLTALPIIETQAGDLSAYIPDERHLDYRRPDLPRERPVPSGRAPGDQRRQLGVARRRLGADPSDAAGGRLAASRPRTVPRTGGVRAVRQRPRQGDTGTAQSRPAAGGDSEAAAVSAARRSRSRSSIIYAATKGFIDSVAVEDVRRYEEELYRFLETTSPGGADAALPRRRSSTTSLRAALEAALEGIRPAVCGRALRPPPSRNFEQTPMPSLIDLRRRIRAVKSTQQITKAMKMIAASRLRRAQDRVVAARPFAQRMLKVLNGLASRVDPDAHPLLRHAAQSAARS